MALCPSPNCSSERTLSSQNESPNSKKKKSKILLLEPLQSQFPDSTLAIFSPLPPPKKRNKSPGIRIVGGRIYDSENGKTCHQCRQKTMDFVVACKSPRDDKPCTMKFCHKCLLNRYGEKAVEADQVEDWKCPKCRGICNCSHCMRKRGHEPTGSLLYTAKATGFRTVLEMLTIEGPEKISASVKKEAYCNGIDDFVSHSNSFTSPSDGYGQKTKEEGIKLENIDSDDNFVVESAYDTPKPLQISWINGWQNERRVRKKKWKKLARAKGKGNLQEGTIEDGAQSNGDVQEGNKENGAKVNGDVQEGTKEDGAENNGVVQEGTKGDGAKNIGDAQEGTKLDGSLPNGNVQQETNGNGAQNNAIVQDRMDEDCAPSKCNGQEGKKEDGDQLDKTAAAL